MIKSILEKLLTLLQDSVITQSLLVIAVFGTMIYCVMTGIPIPDSIDKYGFVIVGFFFGSKATYQVLKGTSQWKNQ